MSFQLPDVPDEYYFITAPEDVNWDKASEAAEVEAYGTNNPYINYGMTKMRRLNFSNAMVEGFSAGREVENDVLNLEACMQMQLDTESGFAAPYCWYAWAGSKCYGIYVITNVKVTEKMRDMEGKATRAFVDVALQQVPSYQVGSGQDLSSQAFTGRFSEKTEETLVALQDAKVKGANGGVTSAATDAATNAATNTNGDTPLQGVDPERDLLRGDGSPGRSALPADFVPPAGTF